MKQEPIKKMKLPRYAAALAALSRSAGMLTACNDPVQIEGVAPEPAATTQYTEPVLMGEASMVEFCTESSEASDTTASEIQTVLTEAPADAADAAPQVTFCVINPEDAAAHTKPSVEIDPDLQIMGLVPTPAIPDSVKTETPAAGEEAPQ